MPLYEYRCERGHITQDQAPMSECNRLALTPCPLILRLPNGVFYVCSFPLHRSYSFTPQRPMPEHFNHSVNAPISSHRQFAEALKRRSEAASERLGLHHNFQPVDLSDRAALGVTDEGLSTTHDALVRSNLKDPTPKLR